MKQVFKGRAWQLVVIAFAAVSSMGQAHAEPVAVIEVTCPATGPAIAACVGAGIVLNELLQLSNGETPFGANGELMKVIAVPVKILAGNVKGAERESGEVDKMIRAVTGISLKAINEHGLWGGPNSIFRKPWRL
jgi:hypothetical protein